MANWICLSCGQSNGEENRVCYVCHEPKLEGQKEIQSGDGEEEANRLAYEKKEDEDLIFKRPEATGE